MTATERDFLAGWLLAHPAAWHGWPTRRALEGVDVLARLERLTRHGCPFVGRKDVVDAVDDLVVCLRKERAAVWAGKVYKAL